jgi:hypothetical protein
MAKKLDNALDGRVDKPIYRPAPTPVAGPQPLRGIRTTFDPNKPVDPSQRGLGGAAVNLPVQPPGGQFGIDPHVDYFQNEQLRMIQALQQAARGDPNSRAQQQMRDVYQQQRGQIASGISGARGVAAGAAQEMIQRNQAAADQAYNLDSRSLMSQEQLRAQQALLTELGYNRDQNINKEEERLRAALGLQTQQDNQTRFDLSRDYSRDRRKAQDAIDLLLAQLNQDISNRAYNDELTRKLIEAGATGSSAALDIYKKSGSQTTQPTYSGKLTDLMGDK